MKKLFTRFQGRARETDSYGRRIDWAMLADTAWPPADKPLAYTCGPTAAVEAVATYLLEFGYQAERIKTERFGPTGG